LEDGPRGRITSALQLQEACIVAGPCSEKARQSQQRSCRSIAQCMEARVRPPPDPRKCLKHAAARRSFGRPPPPSGPIFCCWRAEEEEEEEEEEELLDGPRHKRMNASEPLATGPAMAQRIRGSLPRLAKEASRSVDGRRLPCGMPRSRGACPTTVRTEQTHTVRTSTVTMGTKRASNTFALTHDGGEEEDDDGVLRKS